MLLEMSGEVTPERMKRWSQSKNNTHVSMNYSVFLNIYSVPNYQSKLTLVSMSLSGQLSAWSYLEATVLYLLVLFFGAQD